MPLSSFWFAAPAAVVVNPISKSATESVGQLGGSNVDRINDGDNSTLFTTASRPLGSDLVIANLDFGSAQTVAGFIAYQTQQAASDAVTMRVEWSTDDTNWTTFGSYWLINPGNSAHDETQTPTAVTKRYWRLIANQNFDAVASCAELALFETTGQMP